MPTYIFVDKQEIEDLKNIVKKIQEPKPSEKPKSLAPLGFALAALTVATLLAALVPDAKWALYSYVIGVVIAQCGVDLYRGENRPKWSAAFRLLALAAWYVTQQLSR
jgi:hypothetical protein